MGGERDSYRDKSDGLRKELDITLRELEKMRNSIEKEVKPKHT